MKGVLLAGGLGTRLRPATLIYNKHLALVYDEPMILHPLWSIHELGIKDVLIVTGGEHVGAFAEFLGDGSDFGFNITYKVQTGANGISGALLLAEDFVPEGEKFVVILGDNYFEDLENFYHSQDHDCAIFVKEVEDPQRFGVYADNEIIEKPSVPKSKLAVVGLYFYTTEIFEFIRGLKPSARGELEITDVNNFCLKNLKTEVIRYKGFWSDMGTPDSLLKTANFIKDRQNDVNYMNDANAKTKKV